MLDLHEEYIFEMKQLVLILREQQDGYIDPVSICQAEGVEMSIKLFEKLIHRGQND